MYVHTGPRESTSVIPLRLGTAQVVFREIQIYTKEIFYGEEMRLPMLPEYHGYPQ